LWRTTAVFIVTTAQKRGESVEIPTLGFPI
jgi:hypothetical protein